MINPVLLIRDQTTAASSVNLGVCAQIRLVGERIEYSLREGTPDLRLALLPLEIDEYELTGRQITKGKKCTVRADEMPAHPSFWWRHLGSENARPSGSFLRGNPYDDQSERPGVA